jgi:hypothetical protein
MGERSRQTCAAAFPSDRFYCLLDELPMHLLPKHVRKAWQEQPEESQDLYLNPECRLCAAEELPEEIAARPELLSGFALQRNIAWVRDPWGGALLPFWLGGELEPIVRTLHRDAPASVSAPPKVRKLLAAAGILVPESERAGDGEKIRKTAALFQENGYAPIGDLIHPLHVAALRRYYRYLLRSGAVQLGDGQSKRRYVAYNEPVARFFHQAIASKLSAVAGLELKPSYVYMASYLSGAELKKHVDREQCEYSVTLCLDFSPEPELETPWPIELDTAKGSVKVYQALGDALAYRGTQLPHYRGVLDEGQTSTSIFFHYVAADFAGPLG